MTTSSTASVSKKAIGLALIFCTAIIWILTSFISESLVSSSASGEGPKVPPFLLTWLATTLFTLYLPVIYIKQWIEDCWHTDAGGHKQTRYQAVPNLEAPSQVSSFETPTEEPHVHTPQHTAYVKTGGLDPEAHQQAITAALWATPLWFMAQYTFNLSLSMTSVTSNTILSSTSSLFTFGLSVILLGEKFTVRKLGLIIATMVGTALVTLSDVKSDPGSFSAAPPPPALLSQALPTAGTATLLAWQAGVDVSTTSAQRRLLDTPTLDTTPRDVSKLERLLRPSPHWHDGMSLPVGLGPGAASLMTHRAAAATTAVAVGIADAQSAVGIADAQSAVLMSGTASGVQDTAPPTSTKSPLLGDVLVLLSGGFYATYTVVMRLKMPGEEAGQQVAAFFGYVGLFTTICLAPVVVLLLGVGSIDIAAIPRSAYLIILLEGLLDYVLSDYLWARAVMLVGPTVATLSLSVQIPLAGIMDLIVGEIPGWVHHSNTIALTLLGTCLILAGFVGINLSSTSGTHSTEGSNGQPGSPSRRAHRDSERGLLIEDREAGGSGGGAVPQRGRGSKGGVKERQGGGGGTNVVVQAVMRMLGQDVKDKDSGDDLSPGLGVARMNRGVVGRSAAAGAHAP